MVRSRVRIPLPSRGAAPVALLAGTLLVAAAAAAPGSPSGIVQQTVDEVIAVLENGALSPEERRSRIETIAYARFDMKTMSKLVLARNWKQFSPEQQSAYVEEFKRYLANYYGARIDSYDQERVEILGERTEPRGDVTVQTKIIGGQYEDATVDYRMRKSGDTWQVIDVIVEGISLVSNYRDQFREVLSRGGPERLLQQLREKNAKGVVDLETTEHGG